MSPRPIYGPPHVYEPGRCAFLVDAGRCLDTATGLRNLGTEPVPACQEHHNAGGTVAPSSWRPW